ncbi:unnamed protein product, partial [Effrenium voratum]
YEDRTLHALSELFPASEFQLVWAVAPTVHPDLESKASTTPALLAAGQSVRLNGGVLVQQLEACARAAPHHSPSHTEPWHPRIAKGHCRDSILAVFKELCGVQGVGKHCTVPADLCKMEVPYIPCLAEGDGAALFHPRYAAQQSAQSHGLLSPALGILRQEESVRAIGKLVGVPSWPSINALKASIPSSSLKVAVALCTELAHALERLEGAERPSLAELRVPTSSEDFVRLQDVYINDAPWSSSNRIQTLHDLISHPHARLLGCTSVRDQLAEQCEDAQADDAFGQESNLVDQIKRLLNDYSSRSDVVAEFVQNTDDFGASELKFMLSNDFHPKDQVVDKRCEDLQGPALYICSNKPLAEEDIARMQKVGGSAKQNDFASTGRFGVGLNVMYRYSDCPQLCANGYLHFFDVSRSFVAREGQRRGKKFDLTKLQNTFPDSFAPFQALCSEYPVVFRLPLRTERSELGEATTPEAVEGDLQEVSAEASKMLLFAKWLRSIRIEGMTGLLCEHTVSFQEGQAGSHDDFFASLPSTVEEVTCQQNDISLSVSKQIASQVCGESSVRSWMVVYTLALASEPLRQLCGVLFHKALGGALLPLAAAAVPEDLGTNLDGGVCCGLPTPLTTGASSWISGTFILSSSRKVIPLTHEADDEDRIAWNLEILKGPAAQSVKAAMMLCRSKVKQAEDVDKFFGNVPSGDDTLQCTLAAATFSAALSDAIFPVVSCGAGTTSVDWVEGPMPLLRATTLPDDLQDALAFDGLPLVTLPPAAKKLYETCLKDPEETPRELHHEELCEFLSSTWRQKLDISTSVAVTESGISSLSQHDWISQQLRFVLESDWRGRLQTGDTPTVYICEHLEGVPLLRTVDEKLSTFSQNKLRFTSDRQLLPEHPDLFLHDDTLRALNIDLTETKQKVELQVPGVRALQLDDLVHFKEELEEMAHLQPDVEENRRLKHLWRFIAKGAKGRIPGQLTGWELLPVCSTEARRLAVSLDRVGQTVLCSQKHEEIQDALLQAGIYILQTTLEESALRLLGSQVVSQDSDLLRLLVTFNRSGGLSELSGKNRHALLAFFSKLAIDGKTPLTEVRELPLFKMAQGSSFTSLLADQEATQYCCLDPHDPRAGALETLRPSSAVLLAWPTASIKPIYEHLGVRLCGAEKFMLEFILPNLEEACSKGAAHAKPYLDQLQEFVLIDKSLNIEAAARELAFVPSRAGHVHKLKSFLDPELELSRCFAECLSSYLPVQWMHQYLKLLQSLGMRRTVEPAILLECASHLDAYKDEQMTTAIQEMSACLAEAWAHAFSLYVACAQVGGPDADFSLFREVSQHHIFLTMSWTTPVQIAEEVGRMAVSLGGEAQGGTLRLLPLQGTALGKAAELVWSVCPVMHSPEHPKGCGEQLQQLVNHHRSALTKLGALVDFDKVSLDLVLMHVRNLCSLHPEKEELQVEEESMFYEQLKRCLKIAAKRAEKSKRQFADMSQVRCVRVKVADAADNPEQAIVVLATPRRSFFEGDAFRAGDFHGHLRAASMECEGFLKALGVRKAPEAQDLADVTERVAKEAKPGCIMDHQASVIKTCLRRFGSMGLETGQIANFHCLDSKGELAPVSELVCLDVESWQDRLTQSKLRFCDDEVAGSHALELLLQYAGLTRVSQLVKELPGADSQPVRQESVQDSIQQMMQHPDFAEAVEVLLEDKLPVSEVQSKLAGQSFESTPLDFTTVLSAGNVTLEGSERQKCVFFQPPEPEGTGGRWLISDATFNNQEQAVEELLEGLRRLLYPASPKLLKLLELEDRLRALLKLAFTHGPSGIPGLLRERNIQSHLVMRSRFLSVGDAVPEEYSEQLVYDMRVMFEVGEHVVAEVDRKVVGIVKTWTSSDSSDAGTGLSRRYRVQVAADGTCQILGHTKLYKIAGPNSAPALQCQLVASGGATVVETAEAQPREQLEQVKAYLREISSWEQADYKRAIRRLYLTWHPDKAGDTPFNNMVFRMLSRHCDWYCGGKPESDDWLNDYMVTVAGPSESATEPQAPQRPTPSPCYPSQQESWFEEFERERRSAPATGSSRELRVDKGPQAAAWKPPRIVDERQAKTWLRQAEEEVKAMQKLVEGGAFPSFAVWFGSQAVEKALKSAMLRTCGVAQEEFTGKGSHDLPAFYRRLKSASAETEPQSQAQQQMPGEVEDMIFLKTAYIEARYPNASDRVPAFAYTQEDAARACDLAKDYVAWAKGVEDLPEPGLPKRCRRRIEEDSENEQEVPLAAPPPEGPRAHPADPAPSLDAAPKRQRLDGAAEPLPAAPAPPPLATRTVQQIDTDAKPLAEG